jgi:hypothetical protein
VAALNKAHGTKTVVKCMTRPFYLLSRSANDDKVLKDLKKGQGCRDRGEQWPCQVTFCNERRSSRYWFNKWRHSSTADTHNIFRTMCSRHMLNSPLSMSRA